jgi:hypothetical protein
MWFITVFETREINELGWTEYGCQRCWGYYSDHDKALSALHENRTDMWETIYDYAVLEKIPEGLIPDPEEVQWFKFDMKRNGYFEIPMPEGENGYSSFTIG